MAREPFDRLRIPAQDKLCDEAISFLGIHYRALLGEPWTIASLGAARR